MSFDLLRVTRIPLAYWWAFFMALVAAILTLAAPHWLLERGVSTLGIDQVFSAAEPPLGHKARILFAVLGASLVTTLILLPYAIYRLITARRPKRHFQPKTATVKPSRADMKRRTVEEKQETQIPSRRPIFADQELGAPLMSEGALARAKAEQAANEVAFVQPSELAPAVERKAPVVERTDSVWHDSHENDLAPIPQRAAAPKPIQPFVAPLPAAPIAPLVMHTPLDEPVVSAHTTPAEPKWDTQEAIWDHHEPLDQSRAFLPQSMAGAVAAPSPTQPEHNAPPLSDMIARLERGINARSAMPSMPPEAEVAAPAPHAPVVEPAPIVPPLSVVPRAPVPHDAVRTVQDDQLAQAMDKLSALVGGQR